MHPAALNQKQREIIADAGMRAGAIRFVLIGSRAKGLETSESDLDLVVQLPPEASLLRLVGLKQELEDRLNIHVDLLDYDGLSSRFRQIVESEGVPL